MDISVVLPTRNDAPYIADAIDSVLTQTHWPREIIVVDGGSEDGTIEKVSGYVDSSDVEVTLLEGGKGIAEDLNQAIKHARSPLIARIDGDDRYRPRKLEREHDRLTATGAAFAYSNHVKIDEHGRPFEQWTRSSLPEGDVFRQCFTRQWPKNTLFRFPLVRRKLLEKIGLYNESLDMFEDWDLKIRLSAAGEAARCDAVGSEYRQHGSSITARPNWIKRANAVHEVYAANRSALHERAEAEQMRLASTLSELFFRYEALAELERGNSLQGLQRYVAYLMLRPAECKNLHLHRKFAKGLLRRT